MVGGQPRSLYQRYTVHERAVVFFQVNFFLLMNLQGLGMTANNSIKEFQTHIQVQSTEAGEGRVFIMSHPHRTEQTFALRDRESRGVVKMTKQRRRSSIL